MEHWKAQLINRPPPIPVFPFAKHGFRNPDAPPSFHLYKLPVAASLSLNARFLCQNNDCSQVHFGLAALQLLLVQLTGTDDFVIGLGRVLGAKRNIMPVRFESNAGSTSQQLLEQTVGAMQDSKIYLYEPVEVLLAELGVSRQTALHRVTFSWLLSGLAADGTMDMYFHHTQDLVLLMQEDDARNLVVFVALDQTTYDEEFAKVVAELYVRAMERMVSNSDTSIVDVDLFDPEERQFNMALGTGPVVESSFHSVLHSLQEVALSMPDHVAAKDEHGDELTYNQLVRHAVVMSSDLKSHGIVRGTPVCVIGPPTVDLLCSIIAIWCAGGIYVPLDHQSSLEDNLAIAEHCETEFCVVSRPELIQYAHHLGLGTTLYCAEMAFDIELQNIEEYAPSDLAAALHALTSDGTPKLVLLTYENLKTLAVSCRHYFDEENQVILQSSRWTSNLALFQILFALTTGGTLVLAPELDDADVSKVMVKERITVTVATPSEYCAWFQQPLNQLRDCSDWKFAFSSEEDMSSNMVRNFAALKISNLELINMYGATETSIVCCMGFVDYKEYAADTEGKLIPAGQTLPNYRIWIADSLGRALPPGWTGDIWVTGSGAIGGYSGSEVDDHRMQVDPGTGATCFQTGDRGFLNDEGVLFVVSRRLDESVALVGGDYVELGDISRAIIDDSKGRVAKAVVFLSKGSEQDEPQVQAFILMSKGANAESQRYLQSMLRSLDLPTYMRPTRAVLLETMPRTASGRINRGALRDMVVPEDEVVKV